MAKIPHIRPYHRKRLSSEENVESLWNNLDHAITLIQDHRESTLSFEELYRTAYRMCNQSQSLVCFRIFYRVSHEFLRYIRSTELVTRLTNKLKSRAASIRLQLETYTGIEDAMFLKKLTEAYSMYCLACLKISDILMYLDKNYCQKKNLPTVFSIAMSVFESEVIMAANLNRNLQSSLLSLLMADRNGMSIDRSPVKACTSMLVQLGGQTSETILSVYDMNIGRPYLDAVDLYYATESRRLLNNATCSEYVKYTIKHLNEEEERCDRCLHETTKDRSLQLVRQRLLEDHVDSILSLPNGINNLIDDDRFFDLYFNGKLEMQLLLKTVCSVPSGLPCIKNAINNHILNTGRTLLASHKDRPRSHVSLIQGIMDMRKRYNCIISLDGIEPEIVSAIRESMLQGFETFINELPEAPEYLSLYMDEHFKRGVKSMGDEEGSNVFKVAIEVFRSLQDKDVFERFYKQHFARRLLLQKSASDDAERTFLELLKAECGSNYTKKLEAMYRDWQTREVLQDRFRDATKLSKSKPQFDFRVSVLTCGSWPFTQQEAVCRLPKHLMQACKIFEKCYCSWHSGRKLMWDYTLGNAEVTGKFGQSSKKRYVFQVTTLQMVVLLQFSTNSSNSLQELHEATQIGYLQLNRTLQCLTSGKVKLLLKTCKSNKGISSTDTYCVNEKFSSRMMKIKVPQVVTKEIAANESKEALKQVNDERKHEIEACIVRTLKARKLLNYNDIVIEVTQQLSHRFRPSPTSIKKRLETLIDQEFIKRDDQYRTLYRYLA
eukprot:gene5538-8920_t